MLIAINPLSIDNIEHTTLLRALLDSNKARIYWAKNLMFKVFSQEKYHHIELTNDMILAPSEDGRVAYRVIAKHFLGEGTNGLVYAVECTLSFTDTHSAEYSQRNMQVVKISTFPNYCSLSQVEQRCNREYFFSKKTTHLGAERPLIEKDQTTNEYKSFMVMNRVLGVELFDIIVLLDSRVVNSSFLMRLTIELLAAYKAQVLDRGIVFHADIKPENIMVDVGLNPSNLNRLAEPGFVPERLDIKIIDYAACRKKGEVLDRETGTMRYMAPEIRQIWSPYTILDEKPDIYSLGICIALIWFRSSRLESPASESYREEIEFIRDQFYLPEKTSLPIDKLVAIHHVILGMMKSAPLERWFLWQAIRAINAITEMTVSPPEPVSIIVSSHQTVGFFTTLNKRQPLPEAAENDAVIENATESAHENPMKRGRS